MNNNILKTVEGALAVGFTIALAVAADPSVLGLSPTAAAICGTVTTVALVGQSALLKVKAATAASAAEVASIHAATFASPTEPAPVSPAAPTEDELLADAEAVTA